MKTLFISFTICFGFCVASAKISAAQVNRKILDKPISIPPGTIRIDSLLKQFSRQTAVEFSFNSNKISPSKKLVVGNQKKTVSQWLTLLNKSFGIQHKFVGNHIILIDNSSNKPVSQKAVVTNKNVVSKIHNKPGNVSQHQAVTLSVKKNETAAIGESTASVEDKPDTSQSLQRSSLTKIDKPVPDSVSKVQQIVALGTKVKDSESIKPQPVRIESDETESRESFQFLLGYSKHGSGDMKGIVFGSEYWKDLSRKISLGFMLRATINSERDEIIFNDNITGTVTDASVRFTTAGVQLGTTGAYDFVNTLKSKFGLHLGVFGRYQSASNGSDGYSIIYPPISNYPGALIEYNNRTPQHTVSFGGLFQLQYQYQINSLIYSGLVAGFQTDTNGDAIIQVGLIFGRKL